jgi:hypothetical protein
VQDRFFIEEFGTEPRHVGHFVHGVENFNPEWLSAGDYRKRDRFDHPQVVRADFAHWAEIGLTEEISDEVYRIAEAGHAVRNCR